MGSQFECREGLNGSSFLFGELGVLEIDGKPYFPAATCAKALGYKRPNDALHAHCRYTVKRRIPHLQNPNKEIELNFIPEGAPYHLITHGKLPAADRFEKWVFAEVLSSIRKHSPKMLCSALYRILWGQWYLGYLSIVKSRYKGTQSLIKHTLTKIAEVYTNFCKRVDKTHLAML